MDRPFELAVREQLAAYLADEISLDELKTWLVASTWDRGHDTGSSGRRYANEIKLALAEHSSEFRTDAELQDDLTLLLNRLSAETVTRAAS